MTAPGTRGRTASTSKPKARKGAAVGRALVMQGLAMQLGVVGILLLMAFLSRRDPFFLGAYLWSLVVPAGIGYAFWQGQKRVDRSTAPLREAERAEGKRALSLVAGVLVVWVVGLVAWFFVHRLA